MFLINLDENIRSFYVTRVFVAFAVLYPLAYNARGFDAFVLPKFATLLVISAALLMLAIDRRSLLQQDQRYIRGALIFFIFLVVATLCEIFITDYSIKKIIIGEYTRFDGVIAHVSYAILFTIAAIYLTPIRTMKVATALSVSALLVSLLSLSQQFGFKLRDWQNFAFESEFDSSRSFATLGSASDLSVYLALMIPILIAMFIRNDGKRPLKIFLLITISMSCTSLYFTYSRASIISVILGVFALAVIFNKRLFTRDRIKYVVAISSIMVLMTLFLLTSSSVFRERFDPSSFSESSSLSSRVLIWSNTLEMIADSPLAGISSGNYSQDFVKYIDLGWEKEVQRETIVDKAHNFLLNEFAENGLVVGVTYLALLVMILIYGLRNIRKLSGNDQILHFGIYIGIISYLIAISIHFNTVTVEPIFWMLSGVLIGNARDINGGRRYAIRNDDQADINSKVYQYRFYLCRTYAYLTILFALCLIIADINFMKAFDNMTKTSSEVEVSRSFFLAHYYNRTEDQYYLTEANAYLLRGKATGQRKYLDQAEKSVEVANRISPNNEQILLTTAEINLAIASLKQDNKIGKDESVQRLNNAELVYKKVIAHDPYLAKAHFMLGNVYLEKRDLVLAKREYVKALAIFPAYTESIFALTQLYESEGNYQHAMFYLKKVDSTQSRYPEAVNAIKRFEAMLE